MRRRQGADNRGLCASARRRARLGAGAAAGAARDRAAPRRAEGRIAAVRIEGNRASTRRRSASTSRAAPGRRSTANRSTPTSAPSTRWASSRTSTVERTRAPRDRCSSSASASGRRSRASRSRAPRSSAARTSRRRSRFRPTRSSTPRRCGRGIADAKKLYEEKGYLDATITPKTEPVAGADNEIALTYVVDEGKIVRIQEIEIEGNTAFSDRKLKRVMTTSEENLISRFTGAGVLNAERSRPIPSG
jgi:hypothetical protein